MEIKRQKEKLILVTCLVLVIVAVLVNIISVFSAVKTKIVSEEKVALIRVLGPVYESKRYIELLHNYQENGSVKAIILRLETPGGTVAAAQEIYEEIEKVKAGGKKVVVSMGNIATSGGLYIACASDMILANQGTLTGSIGVLMEFPNLAGLFQKIGFRMEVVKSGAYKDIGAIDRNVSPEEQKILQGVVNESHEQFVEAILRNRSEAIKTKIAEKQKCEIKTITPEAVKKALLDIADGRVMSGRQALSIGLVDRIGNLDDAVDCAGKLSGMQGKPSIVEERKKSLFYEVFFDAESSIKGFLQKVQGCNAGPLYLWR